MPLGGEGLEGAQVRFAALREHPSDAVTEGHGLALAGFDLLGGLRKVFSASPTMPRSAIWKMGASSSLLMAMIFFAPFMPTTCCVAPLIPTAM